MNLRSRLGAVRRDLLYSVSRRLIPSVSRRLIPLGKSGPIVSFTFDDFPRNAVTVGGNILERLGARATYYVAMGLMGETNRLGAQFTRDDLLSLVERKHELASHTFSHVSARDTSMDRFIEEVMRGEKAIDECIGIAPSRNFSYPYGECTFNSKRVLGPLTRSSRGTCGGCNGPEVDLNLLRANSLCGGMDSAVVAQALIRENELRRGWLIFYSHDVSSRPSPFGCTPQLLDAIATFALEKGARLLTVSAALDEIGARTPGSGFGSPIPQRPSEGTVRS